MGCLRQILFGANWARKAHFGCVKPSPIPQNAAGLGGEQASGILRTGGFVWWVRSGAFHPTFEGDETRLEDQ